MITGRVESPGLGSVAGMDPSELTPVAQDYLKVIWSATEWGDPPITTTALAARLGTTAPNVADTVKRLAAQGLVEYRPYKPVNLTTAGRDYAVAMVRRHRLLETFLVITLGYSWDQVHDEADRLEHAASQTLIERIDALLGHPTRDPHGDPIPTVEGHTHRPAHAIRLADAAPDIYRIARVSDADPARLNRFSGHGLRPGQTVRVGEREAGGLTLSIPGNDQAPLVLAPEEAKAIWVSPAASAVLRGPASI